MTATLNLNTVRKLYDRLTAAERLPLLIEAAARDDDIELHRLASSGPRITVTMPDTYPAMRTVATLAMNHALTVLDSLVSFQTLDSFLKHRSTHWEPDEKMEAQLYAARRLYAYLVVAHVDGWRQFCADLGIKPDTLLADIPAYAHVVRAEEHIREAAFTEAEAGEALLDQSKMPAGVKVTVRPITAVLVAAALHERLAEFSTIQG